MRNRKENNWKQLDKELLDPIADKLTSFLEYITPERKELKREPSSEEEDYDNQDPYRRRRRARYEVLKERYKD